MHKSELLQRQEDRLNLDQQSASSVSNQSVPSSPSPVPSATSSVRNVMRKASGFASQEAMLAPRPVQRRNVIARKESGDFDSRLDALSANANPEQVGERGVAGGGSGIPFRKEMETTFGTDLGAVQAYSGPAATAACESLGAEAYAMDDKIAFKSASPDKGTVAHEVTHALQHQGGVATKSQSALGDAAEQEARAVESAVNAGGAIPLGALAASGARIDGDWLEGAEGRAAETGEGFWTEIKNATATELTNYCANVLGTAVSSFGDAMATQSETGPGSLVLNSIITLIGGIPGDIGSAVSAIAQVAVAVYTYVRDQTGAPAVDFATFMSNARNGQAAISAEITGRSHPIFRAIDTLKGTETDANRATLRQQAVRDVRTARRNLPSMQKHMQAMTAAWVAGAADSWDAGSDAGVVEVSYGVRQYDYSRGVDVSAFIDDVERPAGTIQAMKQAFGDSTPLEQTPLRMSVSISHTEWEDTGTNRGYRPGARRSASATKAAGTAPLALSGGERELLDSYKADSSRARVSTLAED